MYTVRFSSYDKTSKKFNTLEEVTKYAMYCYDWIRKQGMGDTVYIEPTDIPFLDDTEFSVVQEVLRSSGDWYVFNSPKGIAFIRKRTEFEKVYPEWP